MLLNRAISEKVLHYLKLFPCVALLGPRQTGKTTLVKMLQDQYERESIYLDLESDEDIVKLSNAELYFDERDDKLIILDEIQRNPNLFVLIRAVIDKKRINGRFLILGSASPELLAQSSETLAGRIAYLEMHPFFYEEVRSHYHYDQLWLRGGFPDSLIQVSDESSIQIRQQFVKTYIERELAVLGLSASSIRLRNLLRMLTHVQGQLLNYSQLSGSLGIDTSTLKRYMDYFENAFLIRRLEPFHTNLKKRLVKSPKCYIRDTGVYHAVCAIENKEDLDGFPGKGYSWETFVVQQIIGSLKQNVEPYFYRTHDGSELDLVLVKGTKVVAGLEIKLSNSPTITRGTTIASEDLGNIPVYVVTHSVSEDYKHNEYVTVTSFENIFSHLSNLKLIG
jgi:predicted AAA+ superfamily ATPase